MIEIILALLIIFFLPGFFLVNALFPRKGELDREYDALYRITLGIVMSIIVVVLLGFGLNSLGVNPSTNKGYFVPEYIWGGLGILTLVFFLIGWWRGAYPFLAKLHPSLLRLPSREPQSVIADIGEDKKVILKFQELAEERERLRRQIKDYERRMGLHTGTLKEHYERRKMEAQDQLKKVDSEIRKLEERWASELY